MTLASQKQSADSQILKKHVAAIHIGAKLSLLQRKLVNALLYNAYEQLLTAQEHKISAPVLCEMIGFDSKNIGYLKGALKGLMETVVEFDVLEEDGERSWEAMVLLPYAKIKGGECTYRYERALAEKLYHPDVYSKINLSVLREMKSSHALVLYENCYRFEGIGHTAWWDIEVFRKLMAVDTMSSYKPFKALNRNVIQPAMKEVNALSNIQIEMETRMKGRTVTGLRFLIKPNSQLSLIGMDAEDEITDNPAYQALLKERIPKTLARAWVIEYGDKYIFEKLDLAGSQAATGRIKSSKAGFLKAAVEQDYHNEDAEQQKLRDAADKKRADRKELEAQLEAASAAVRASEAAYRRYCSELIETHLSGVPESLSGDISNHFARSLSSDVYISAFKSNGWRDRLNFPDIKKFWESRGLSFLSPDQLAKQNGDPSVEHLRFVVSDLKSRLE